jgi:hypothetical protein
MAPLIPVETVSVGPFSVAANISNVGTTPAIHIRTTTGQNAAVCPDRFDPDKVALPPEERESNGWLLPNSPATTAPSTIFINQAALDKLASHECGFYICGRIIYCDIFSISQYRHFCWKWKVGTPREFDAFENYNDGDEDYPDLPPRNARTRAALSRSPRIPFYAYVRRDI